MRNFERLKTTILRIGCQMRDSQQQLQRLCAVLQSGFPLAGDNFETLLEVPAKVKRAILDGTIDTDVQFKAARDVLPSKPKRSRD